MHGATFPFTLLIAYAMLIRYDAMDEGRGGGGRERDDLGR